jgi:hypothetical protein
MRFSQACCKLHHSTCGHLKLNPLLLEFVSALISRRAIAHCCTANRLLAAHTEIQPKYNSEIIACTRPSSTDEGRGLRVLDLVHFAKLKIETHRDDTKNVANKD